MAKAVTHSRYSRFADGQSDAEDSPFREDELTRRVQAALAMVRKRKREAIRLEEKISRVTDPKQKRRMRQSLIATQRNMESWKSYLRDAAKDPRSVIVPPMGQ